MFPKGYNPGGIKLMEELFARKQAVERRVSMDPKEAVDRETAANRYALENEKHYVDYVQDALDQSVTATREIREMQAACYNMFKEKAPAGYNQKAPWQSRVVVPKPFSTVMYGASAVKKAFTPDFLTIKDERHPEAETFWKTVLLNQTNRDHANLPQKFTDATIMALAVGKGMEIIPTYTKGAGLRYSLVDPWKVFRDPDAPSRDPQGGLFWIHQEWLDFHVLKEMEKRGQYENVDRARVVHKGGSTGNTADPFMTEEAIKRRQGQIYKQSRFRTKILTSDFRGTVLSPTGELLLPDARFTIAGGRLIEKIKQSPYQRLRWPGISWSPMPDLLNDGGRGLLEGIQTIWEAMCNMLCLHEDALKWIVNPPSEINVDGLVDPLDVDDWPGKKYLVRSQPNGNQVVRPVDRKDNTTSILANMQYHDQNFQRGSMVNDAVQGLPGYRKDITASEAAQNLEQSMGVFGLMGSNLEDGCIQLLHATQDVIETYAEVGDFNDLLPPDIQQWLLASGGEFPQLTGSYSVSGVQSLMKDQEILKTVLTVLAPLAESPIYGPYFKPYNLLRVIETRANLRDEDVIVSTDEATAIDQAKKEMARQAEQAEQAARATPATRTAGDGGE